MNDRLKFRYFNKHSNKMIYPDNYENINAIYECLEQQVCFDENLPILPYDHIGNGLVFMQCTGLKDKNGKLIYEGDIVDCYVSSKKIYRYQIKEEIGSFMLVSPKEEIFDFINKWNDNVYPLSQLYFEYENEENCIEQCKIIGNIYENPELLEKDGKNEQKRTI